MKKIACLFLATVLMAACSDSSVEKQNENKKVSETAKTELAEAVEAKGQPTEKGSSLPNNSKAYYLRELDQIGMALSKLESSYESGSTAALKGGEMESLRRWDQALNRIYGVLKEQLPVQEMETLRQDQREWIELRDLRAQEAAADFEGGTAESVAELSALKKITKERCYFLANNYLSEKEVIVE